MNQKPIALAGPSASQLPSSAPPSPALSLSPVSQEITALITDLQARRQATIQRALQHLLHNAPAGNGNGITHTSAHLLLKELKALTCHASNSVADLKSKLDALVERLLIQAVTASANCKEDRPAAPSPAHRDTAFDVLDGPTALPPSLRDFLFDVQAAFGRRSEAASASASRLPWPVGTTTRTSTAFSSRSMKNWPWWAVTSPPLPTGLNHNPGANMP